MPTSAMRTVPAFVPEALAASQVGTWETWADEGYIVTDAVAAALFGFDPDEAADGLPIVAYQGRVHIADRAAAIRQYAAMREKGGLYVFEYRTMPRPGEVRWVLARGHYRRDETTGAMIGRGIVIDITDSKSDGHIEDRAFYLAPDASEEGSPLDCVAAYAIKARRAIDATDEADRPALRRAVDGFLLVIGRALARRLDGARS